MDHGEEVTDVSCGGYFTIFLTPSRNAYSCGINASGQLGIGNQKLLTDSTSLPTKVCLENITKISTGYNHSLFIVGVNKPGSCYACGENTSGELGTGNLTFKNEPTKILFFSSKNIIIVQISAGRGFSLFLTLNGLVYSCGRNNDGRCGIDSKKHKIIRIPTHVKIKEKIMGIFAGGYHSAFLDDKRQVWSCGANDQGQCGHPKKNNYNSPKLIRYFVKEGIDIVDVSCSREHTLFLTSEKKVYAVGSNKSGQLAYPKKFEKSFVKPRKVDVDKNVEKFKNIYSGDDNSFFITTDDKLYIAGKYEQNQDVVIKDDVYLINLKKKIKSKVQVIRGGRNHIVLLTKDRKFFACGENQNGALGFSNFSSLGFSEVELMNEHMIYNVNKFSGLIKDVVIDKNYSNDDDYSQLPQLVKDIKKSTDKHLESQNILLREKIISLEKSHIAQVGKIKKLEKKVNIKKLEEKTVNNNSPVVKFIHNEMEMLKKDNARHKKRIEELIAEMKSKEDKLHQFSILNTHLSGNNQQLSKTKFSYQKILEQKENEISELKKKIKHMNEFINTITDDKKESKTKISTMSHEEVEKLEKWYNDREDTITAFVVLKEKLVEERNKYNRIKERLEDLTKKKYTSKNSGV